MLFRFFDLTFHCRFSFFLFDFLSSFIFFLFFALVLYFFCHVILSLDYHNLLGNKRLGYCCCCCEGSYVNTNSLIELEPGIIKTKRHKRRKEDIRFKFSVNLLY
jgi:hypothetical protein